MERRFPCFACLPFLPVGAGVRLYITESARAFCQSGQDLSIPLLCLQDSFWHTSCHKEWWCSSYPAIQAWPGGPWWQPGPVLTPISATYSLQVGQKDKPHFLYSISRNSSPTEKVSDIISQILFLSYKGVPECSRHSLNTRYLQIYCVTFSRYYLEDGQSVFYQFFLPLTS